MDDNTAKNVAANGGDFSIGRDYRVVFTRQRRKRGMRPPPTFIILGPLPQDWATAHAQRRMRALTAYGIMVRGHVVIHGGVLSSDQIDCIEDVYAVWWASLPVDAS
jgi:hypothetical protein